MILETFELKAWHNKNLCQKLDFLMSKVQTPMESLIPISPHSISEFLEVW